MANLLDVIKFNKPEFKIISNVTASVIENHESIKKLLVEQIYSKVRWREIIELMLKNEVNSFIEIGPGKVLSGINKRISKTSNSFSINEISDIENNKHEFKK